MAQQGDKLLAFLAEYDRVMGLVAKANGISLGKQARAGTVTGNRMAVLSRSLLGMPMAQAYGAYPTPSELRSAKTRKLKAVHPDKLRSAEFTALEAARLEAVEQAAARLRAYYERAAEILDEGAAASRPPLTTP